VNLTLPRRTLASSASASGRGLFSGAPATITLHPSDSSRGLIFRRTDLPGAPEIPARFANLSTTSIHPAFAKLPARNTTLAENAKAGGTGVPPVLIATVEHILSALAAAGITDALIDIDAPEVPIFDGSAAPFSALIREAGIAPVPGSLTPIIITDPITVTDANGATITAHPPAPPLPVSPPACTYIYHLDYGPSAPMPPQWHSWASADHDLYETEIAPARTFCLDHEAQALQGLGLFKDLTPRDMLVFASPPHPPGPINNSLRFDNEPARHKLLDLIGDLALLGRPLHATVVASRSGHALTHALVRAILTQHG
jgi:UDP-3-O-acyl N-acetylglucosamine deacetylase